MTGSPACRRGERDEGGGRCGKLLWMVMQFSKQRVDAFFASTAAAPSTALSKVNVLGGKF